VPRDLDAICRRCLAKDPDRRYESATAVALELERWLRDEPVRARPAGRGERVARWCRRNPGLAVGAVLLTALLVVGTAAALALVREQDEATRRVVCEDNEHAASLAAGAFLHRLDQHGDFVLKAANDPALRQACRDNDMKAVQALLRGKVEGARAPGVVGIVSLYVLDHTGLLRAIWEDNPKIVGMNFAYRDYYRGARMRAGREGLERVHLSRVFTALNDGLDKLAVSVSFRPTAGGPAWVLAATIPTDPTFGLGARNDGRHKVVLLAPREADPSSAPEYCVLVHPSYTERERAVPFPDGKLRRDGPRFSPDDGYEDPVRERHPECEGRWLAGFAPVEGTELVVLVQQKYDDAVAPQRLFLRRFLAWFGGLVAVGLFLVASFWLVRAWRGRTGLAAKS
jgi:eukaryotic-like serine/threonine-protein kinase